MKPLNDLLSAARRVRQPERTAESASSSPALADEVLRTLRETSPDSDRAAEWVLIGRWAAGAACALAFLAVVAGPNPTSAPTPAPPPSNPLADFAGW